MPELSSETTAVIVGALLTAGLGVIAFLVNQGLQFWKEYREVKAKREVHERTADRSLRLALEFVQQNLPTKKICRAD